MSAAEPSNPLVAALLRSDPQRQTVDIFVARQPIFDAKTRLAGYELLYRGSAVATVAAGASSNYMSSSVIAHSLVDIGLAHITGGERGYINFTREMFVGGYWTLFDPASVMIELLETVEADEEVIAACERSREAGYMIALDDFVPSAGTLPLVPFADVVKVDVLDRTVDAIAGTTRPLAGIAATLLAERVETAEIHAACERLGFSLFQGYHYARPEVIAGKEMPAEQISILRLISLVRDPDTSEAALDEAFSIDLGLTYKLLRIVNSASIGGRGVESIRHAVRLLGRAALARWLGLLMVASFGKESGPDRELAETALARARICERLAPHLPSAASSGSLFMIGLFSLLDRLMRRPMDEIMAEVDLAEDVKLALLKRSGPYAPVLDLLESYEAGDWVSAECSAATLGVPSEEITEIYLDGLQWSRERLASTLAG